MAILRSKSHDSSQLKGADSKTNRQKMVLSLLSRILFPPSGTYISGLTPADAYTMRLVSRDSHTHLTPHLFSTVHLSDRPGRGRLRLTRLLGEFAHIAPFVKEVVIRCQLERGSDVHSSMGSIQLVISLLRMLCRLPNLATVHLRGVQSASEMMITDSDAMTAIVSNALHLRVNLPYDLCILEDSSNPSSLLFCTPKVVALGSRFSIPRSLAFPNGAQQNLSSVTHLHLEQVVLTKDNYSTLYSLTSVRYFRLQDVLILRSPSSSSSPSTSSPQSIFGIDSSSLDTLTWALIYEKAEQAWISLRALNIHGCAYARPNLCSSRPFVRIPDEEVDDETHWMDRQALQHLTELMRGRSQLDKEKEGIVARKKSSDLGW